MNEVFIFWDRMKVHFHHHVVKKGKEAPFWVALAFLMTFGIVRYITFSIRKQSLAAAHTPQTVRAEHKSGLGFHDIELGGGIHLHHMVPGIILTIVSGYLALVTGDKAKRPVSVMYGAGTALALDEFALWLEVRDVYWAKDGRKSLDAVAVAGSLFLGGFALSEFGGAILRDIHHRVTTGTYPPHQYDLNEEVPPDVDAPPEALPAPQAIGATAGKSQAPVTRRASS